ncbi:MAG: tRNA preQ1(34) S-adenosylmethionine ribosyltransferase-isomerase QueA [Bacilli bacterium]|nr:tRNA preQ1(34) S-adenosylmethionine ribosyltransferase-isomerase QueA [Bacilli bacterium]
MNIEDYNYELPESLIAQTPLKNRSDSKLMIVDKKTGKIEHRRFKEIINYLNSGDVLVINESKVMPARLIGNKEKTNAVIELLLLKDNGQNIWECMVRPQRKVKVGTIIEFGDCLRVKCIKVKGDGLSDFEMIYDGIFVNILDELGSMPLPPYIHEQLKDKDRYQTVYAKTYGSAAAPTAGLHFTNELLQELKCKGVIITPITLHVGLGTFKPVKETIITNHVMHSEYYEMSSKTAEILNKAKVNNQRIISVGTTSTRTLETIMNNYDTFKECSGWTDIFIYPGYKFKAIDGLLTNFHLPKSTLIMLVSALAGKDNITKAYREAIENEYRFFSFGDCMLIK